MGAAQDYYRSHGSMTALGAHAGEFRTLPADVSRLCEVVQGLFTAAQEGVSLRRAEDLLTRIRGLDARPLTMSREPGRRLLGDSRDYSLLLCAIAREYGIPARMRCGFADHLRDDQWVEHWACEYWDTTAARWTLIDLHSNLDRERFLIAGEAWKKCRSGGWNAGIFGTPPANGLWLIAGNVIRDLAALNRVEMLPSDVWGWMELDDAGLAEKKRTLMDHLAALTVAGDQWFEDVRFVYGAEADLRPSKIEPLALQLQITA